jgi:hypothetical protein
MGLPMKLMWKIWLIPLVVLLSFALLPSKSFCQSGVVLYPSKGSGFTEIVMEAYVPINSRNNIFWDDKVLALDVSKGQENYPLIMNISCPNEPPYSDLGNHTVAVESFYWDGSDKVTYMNATFEIIEYVPCDEYLALNATYYQLLADYYALNASYQNLIAQYNILSSSYNSLLDQYSSLLENYNSLLGTYDFLSSDYNGLAESYNSLQLIHNILTSNYAQLQGNYTLLVSSFNGLQTEYNNSSIDLTKYRDLTYVFIITSVVFLATTVYFAIRKTKLKT